MHLAHPGHERRERADNGHEAGDDDGLAAVFLVELMGLVQVALLEYLGIGIAEQPPPEVMPDGIVARIAQDGRGKHNQCQDVHLQRHVGLRGDGSRHKQQGITRQEGGNHQAGLAENHQEQDGIRPQMILLDDVDHVHVNVQDEIDNEIHIVIALCCLLSRRKGDRNVNMQPPFSFIK